MKGRLNKAQLMRSTDHWKGRVIDASIVRLVVGFLGAIALCCVAGLVYLQAVGQQPSPALSSAASGAIGALVGILASQKGR